MALPLILLKTVQMAFLHGCQSYGSKPNEVKAELKIFLFFLAIKLWAFLGISRHFWGKKCLQFQVFPNIEYGIIFQTGKQSLLMKWVSKIWERCVMRDRDLSVHKRDADRRYDWTFIPWWIERLCSTCQEPSSGNYRTLHSPTKIHDFYAVKESNSTIN